MWRRDKLSRTLKKNRSESDKRKYKETMEVVQKTERQSYWNYINNIIETNELGNEYPPKQKRLWCYIKSLRKDSTGIVPLKDNGRLFYPSKDKLDILNRQYQTVFTHEDPDSSVPDPDGDPFPDMTNFTISEESVRQLIQKSFRTRPESSTVTEGMCRRSSPYIDHNLQ